MLHLLLTGLRQRITV